MRRHLSVLITFLISAASFGQALTEEEAVQIGLENSFAVRTARSQYEYAKLRTREELGKLGPKVDLQLSYRRYLTTQTFGQGIPGQIDSKAGGVALTYPLDLAGVNGKLAKAARENELSQLDAVTAAENQVRLAVRNAYFGLVQAEWTVSVQQLSLTAAQGRLDNAQKQYDVGEIPRYDVLRFETEVSRAQANVAQAENNVNLAKQVLNNAMSRQVDIPVDVAAPYDNPESAPLPNPILDGDELTKIASTNRAEFSQYTRALAAQKFVTYASRKGLSPSLNLTVNYNHTFDPPAFTLENQTTFAAVMSWPLYDSGVTKAQINESKELEKQIQVQIDQTTVTVGLEVRSAIVRLLNAQQQVELAKRTVTLQEEALRIAEVRYRAGEGILIDVTTGEEQLRQARGGLVNARVEYLNAYAALQKAVGTDDLPQQPGQ